MSTASAFQPCKLSREMLHRPLPFDLYSGRGVLLAKRGTRLTGNANALLAQPLFRARTDAERTEENAHRRLEALFLRYGQLMDHWSCRAEDVRQLKLLAGDLVELAGSHSDVCVCMSPYLPGTSNATRHCFAAAIVSVLLGNVLGWHARRLNTLALAAMTMNLSLLANHDDWSTNRGALSAVQRMNVHRHPCLSADLLAQSPGADIRWITAVDQHHENLDGSGYPQGLAGAEIVPEARILRVADAWCALVLPRSGKCKKTPRDALRELGDSARGCLDHRIFLSLKKIMGTYPPGTFVRLANRETALIVRWDKRGLLPNHALSVLSPAGHMCLDYRSRDVSQFGCGIRDYTHLDMAQMARLSWPRVWAQVGQPAAGLNG